MSKIYIVEHEQVLIKYYDGGGDCCDTEIEKIFDSEEKAVAYIQEEVRKKLEEHADDEYIDEYIDNVPEADEIMKERKVEYYSCSYDCNAYSYKEYEVE